MELCVSVGVNNFYNFCVKSNTFCVDYLRMYVRVCAVQRKRKWNKKERRKGVKGRKSGRVIRTIPILDVGLGFGPISRNEERKDNCIIRIVQPLKSDRSILISQSEEKANISKWRNYSGETMKKKKRKRKWGNNKRKGKQTKENIIV